MGDALTAVFGGGSDTTTDTTVDPTSKALNELRKQQLQSLFANPTAFSSYAQPRPDVYTGSPAVDQLFTTATATPDTSNLLSLDDYTKMGLDAVKGYINQVATPTIMQQATLQGLEGGGYVPEAIAKATAQYGLPFIQTLPQASNTLSLTIPQTRLANAQSASTLFPLADYNRSLQERDLLRQQGVVTTGLTGLPYTPSTSSDISKSSQPFFDFFGQG